MVEEYADLEGEVEGDADYEEADSYGGGEEDSSEEEEHWIKRYHPTTPIPKLRISLSKLLLKVNRLQLTRLPIHPHPQHHHHRPQHHQKQHPHRLHLTPTQLPSHARRQTQRQITHIEQPYQPIICHAARDHSAEEGGAFSRVAGGFGAEGDKV